MFKAIADAVRKFVAPKSNVRVDPAHFQPKPKHTAGAPKGSRHYYRSRATRIIGLTHRDPMYLHRTALELKAFRERQVKRQAQQLERIKLELLESAPVGAPA